MAYGKKKMMKKGMMKKGMMGSGMPMAKMPGGKGKCMYAPMRLVMNKMKK